MTEALYNNQDEHTGQSRKEYHNDNYHLKNSNIRRCL